MDITKNKNIKVAEKGFTIVEVLIALTLFSIAVAGVITVSVQGGTNINLTKNRITANYLADEGIELMRAMRDTAVVNTVLTGGTESDGWAAFTTPAYASLCTTGPCDIDPSDYSGTPAIPFPNNTNVIDCRSTGGFCAIKYDPSTGYYSTVAPSGLPSTFSRAITLTSIPGTTDEIEVTSVVRWLEGSTYQTITQTETLYNWYN